MQCDGDGLSVHGPNKRGHSTRSLHWRFLASRNSSFESSHRDQMSCIARAVGPALAANCTVIKAAGEGSPSLRTASRPGQLGWGKTMHAVGYDLSKRDGHLIRERASCSPCTCLVCLVSDVFALAGFVPMEPSLKLARLLSPTKCNLVLTFTLPRYGFLIVVSSIIILPQPTYIGDYC